MGDVRIEPLPPDRVGEAVALCRAADPHRQDLARQALWAKERFTSSSRHYAALDRQDRLVGYGALTPERAVEPDDRYRMELVAETEALERELWRLIVRDLAEVGAGTVQARVAESDRRRRALLEELGFVETQRMTHLVLRLADYPLAVPGSEWPALPELTITTLSVARHAAGFLERWARMDAAVRLTWPEANPLPGGTPPRSLAEHGRRLFEDPRLLAEGFFIVADGDDFIGYSGLTRDQEHPSVLETWGTGVHPEWRGRGIATLLKMHALRFAALAGYEKVFTATANPTMLAINERLGFQRVSTQIRLVRHSHYG